MAIINIFLHKAREKLPEMDAMKNFFYNTILCYLVGLWSAVRKLFLTNKRSRVAGHEEKKKIIPGKSAQPSTKYLTYEQFEELYPTSDFTKYSWYNKRGELRFLVGYFKEAG